MILAYSSFLAPNARLDDRGRAGFSGTGSPYPAQADKAITMARQVAAAKVQYLKIGFVPSAEIRIFPIFYRA